MTDENNLIGAHDLWAVAYIDILGQREAMAAVEKAFWNAHASQELMESYGADVGKFFVPIRRLHQAIEDWDRSFSQRSAREPNLPAAVLESWRKTRAPERRFQRFSDGLITYLPLGSTSEDYSPIMGIYAMLSACACTVAYMLALGYPIRGGVEIGPGVEMRGSELYGPVVASAYDLESKIAQYPRIIVGQYCTGYVEAVLRRSGEEPKFNVERVVAATCNSLLARDLDGHVFIDFLGEGLHPRLSKIPQVRQEVTKAYQFVQAQQQKHRQDRNTTLAFRYALLRNYFEDRLPSWGLDEELSNGSPKEENRTGEAGTEDAHE